MGGGNSHEKKVLPDLIPTKVRQKERSNFSTNKICQHVFFLWGRGVSFFSRTKKKLNKQNHEENTISSCIFLLVGSLLYWEKTFFPAKLPPQKGSNSCSVPFCQTHLKKRWTHEETLGSIFFFFRNWGLTMNDKIFGKTTTLQ